MLILHIFRIWSLYMYMPHTYYVFFVRFIHYFQIKFDLLLDALCIAATATDVAYHNYLEEYSLFLLMLLCCQTLEITFSTYWKCVYTWVSFSCFCANKIAVLVIETKFDVIAKNEHWNFLLFYSIFHFNFLIYTFFWINFFQGKY